MINTQEVQQNKELTASTLINTQEIQQNKELIASTLINTQEVQQNKELTASTLINTQEVQQNKQLTASTLINCFSLVTIGGAGFELNVLKIIFNLKRKNGKMFFRKFIVAEQVKNFLSFYAT